ncbi:MAG: hypothetical protein F4W90_05850 [Gammaproteobacteria bacterium]|nr:hypothetical protein [Gammaproteobacteria bacterium]
MWLHSLDLHSFLTVLKKLFTTGLICVLFGLTQNASAADAKGLLGDWQLNRELTEKRQPKQPKAKMSNTGFVSAVAVGGVLLPTPGGGSAPVSGTTNLPKVLGCVEMSLRRVGQKVVMACPQLAQERSFAIGKHHGRTVKFSKRKLTEKYSTTSRLIKHQFLVERSDRLEVKVQVKPKRAKMRTFILVFDRASPTNASA